MERSGNSFSVCPQRSVTIWMGTQIASPRVPGCPNSLPIGSSLQPRWSQEPPLEPPAERCARGSDPASAVGAFPRSLTSKGWVSPARLVPPGVFPMPSLPGCCEAPQGKDRRGLYPPPVSQENPGSSPEAGHFLESPLQAPGGEAWGSAWGRPARLPRGGPESQPRS